MSTVITLTEQSVEKADIVTTKDLLEAIQDEVETYTKLEMDKELMNQNVVLQLVDQNGHVLNGNAVLTVGWLRGGGFMITGVLESVYEDKR